VSRIGIRPNTSRSSSRAIRVLPHLRPELFLALRWARAGSVVGLDHGHFPPRAWRRTRPVERCVPTAAAFDE